MTNINQQFEDAISNLETRLKLPRGFFVTLKSEDDWSFVIKSHALLEAALTHLISVKLNNIDLLDFISRLDTSNPNTGKLGLLNTLQCLEKHDLVFISAFSQLRNGLVHDVSNTNFSFTEHIAGFDKHQKRAFCNKFGYAYIESDGNGNDIVDQNKVLKDSKVAIWHGLRAFLAITNVEMEIDEIRRHATDIHYDVLKLYREKSDLD